MRHLASLLCCTCALPAFAQFGTGRDGPLLVSGRLVTERGGVVMEASPAGTNEVSVNGARLAPGDLALLFRARADPSDAELGRWFTMRVHEVRGALLGFSEPLPYPVAAGTQVVRVLEPSAVMIADGGQLVAPPFDGLTGGVLALFTPGEVWNDGVVAANGAGFSGGEPSSAPTMVACPDSSDGGAAQPGAGALSGGAGGGCLSAGGGGGANVGRGGQGGASRDGSRPVGGAGGAAHSANALDRLFLGGGGGAGWTNARDPGIVSSARGGAGGGVVIVRAGRILGSGRFEANGAPGGSFGGTDYGLGGGGAGGVVSLSSQTSLSCSVARANGGAGGGGNNYSGGSGGGGGGGAVVLQAARGATCPAEALAGVGGEFRGGQSEPRSRFEPGFVGLVATLEGGLAGWSEPQILVPAAGAEVTGAFEVRGLASGVASARMFLDRAAVVTVPVREGRFTAELVAPLTPAPFTLEVAALVGEVEVVRSRPVLLRATGAAFEVRSAPAAVGQCGAPWRYDDDGLPEVSTGEPVRWSWSPLADLPAPARLMVDSESGAIRWTPRSSEAGRVGFELTASNGRGRASQRVEVDVDCSYAVGCQVTPPSLLASWGLLALVLRRRGPACPLQGTLALGGNTPADASSSPRR